MSSEHDKLQQWLETASEYSIPDWSELPSIPLYMDQIIIFTGETLKLFERDEKQSLLTSSMINNYVKNGLVEHPVHKKYTKEHLSKLIMTGLLKQVLSIQDISVLFSGDENAEALYGDFTAAQDAALQQTVAELHGEPDEKTLRATALRLAAESNARRAVSERILMALSEKNNEEETKPKKKHKEKE